MLKNILINCANLIGRDDIVLELKKYEKLSDFNDENIKNDISKLLCFYNFITNSIYENYLDLVFCEKIMSDSKSSIDYFKFSKNPIKIIKVENENFKPIFFDVKPNCIITNYPNKLLYISYKFLPDAVNDLTDDISYLDRRLIRIVAYGIVSEFLASNGKISESESWNKKFLFELFKLKNNKERRLKSTFCL